MTSISSALQGKVSGVQSYSTSAAPGSAPSVQVRGVASNSTSAPLYVIDGRIAAGPGEINQNDIESIEILKDGASAAIYGASAGNGVILITTKKGAGKGTVSYEFQLASQSLAKRPSVMSAQEFVDWYTEAGALSLTTIYNNWDGVTDTDWLDVTFGNSLMQKHNIRFQGGNANGQFYTSLSYLNDDGMVVGDKDTHSAITGMINASYKINSWLEVGTNNVIEYSKTRAIPAGGELDNLFASALAMSPIVKPVYAFEELTPAMLAIYNNPDLNGHLLQDKDGLYYGFAPYTSTNRTNPLILRDMSDSESRSFSISGTSYANITPWEWLHFTTRLSYALTSGESYQADHEYFSDSGSGAFRNYLGVSATMLNSVYWQWEIFATALKQFGNHSLSLMLGTSFSQTRGFSLIGGLSGNNNGEKGFAIDDPNFLYFAYANQSAIKTVGGGEPSYGRKLAYFGRANWSYKDKYLLQASLRADAADTSVLPADHRWGFFPAVSGGWVVSKEPWMAPSKGWLSNLKLRASWGQNGSLAALGGYMYDSTISKVGQYNYGNTLNYTQAYAPSVMGNKHLSWETSEQVDLGVDASFFAGRFTLTTDWYRKETKDLIVTGATLSNIAGFGSSPINAGSILNTGVELDLGWQDHIGDFFYGVRANATTLKNKVIKVADTVNSIDGAGVNLLNVVTRFEKGYPAWYLYGYEYTGVNPLNGEPQFADHNADGFISDGDKTYIGKGIPDVSYGITLNAAWKGFDLVVFGSGAAGFQIFNAYDTALGYVTNKPAWQNEDRWSLDNLTGSRPAPGKRDINYIASNANVFKGDYFKIKQIQLGYTIPDSITSKVKMHNVRAYVSLENFFTFTAYPGFDPEVAGAGSSTGVDYGLYPNPKKVLAGIALSF